MGDQDPKGEGSPLYGATPHPTSGSSSKTPQPAPVSTGSSPEIKLPDHSKTTNPLFGATPPTQVSSPPRIPTRARLPLHHPSTLPAYLRRLGYIISLVLGSSAVIAGIWSAFILPLLHASFSARRAIVDQQKDRWIDLVKGLREVRARSIYPAPTESAGSVEITKDESEEKTDLEEGEEARLIDHEENKDEITSIESLLPLSPVASLSQTLRDLVTAFTSTSTTRTSLLSTLESYTSHLHRQLYLRNHPISFGGGSKYGLNTLSDNLAKAGGKSLWSAFDQSEGDSGGLENVGVKSEEWDAVRKEVRAIKGMLLSRRNFMTESESR